MVDRPSTIADVAQYAGVSKATVSRVINGNYPVSDILQQRVEEAIAKLGYEPDRAARRLRANLSELIGIIIPDIQNPFFTSVVRGIEDVAYEQHMNVLLCNTDDDPRKQEGYIRIMMAERVAGLILAPSFGFRADLIQQLVRSGLSVILVDRSVPNLDVDAVLVDNYRGAYLATTHLISLGYQRIGCIVGDLDLSPGRERHQGYLQALEDHGRPIDHDLIGIGHFKIESGFDLAWRMLQQSTPPDALFTASNLITLGAFKAIRESGRKIPHDIAIVGFDDMPWASELYSPLTAVSQPTYEVGREAVRLLLRRLNSPAGSGQTVTLQPTLTIRESCGAYLLKGGNSIPI